MADPARAKRLAKRISTIVASAIEYEIKDPRLAGVTFGELPETLRRQGASGVQVSTVANDSRAARAGLRSGDVILEATTGRFNDLASFRASFRQPPQQLAFRIWRDGGRIGTLAIP